MSTNKCIRLAENLKPEEAALQQSKNGLGPRGKMQKTARVLAWVLALSCTTDPLLAYGAAEGPRLGKPATPEEIAAWNLTVYPDGRGLPPGHGNATEGKLVYERFCGSCHGTDGAGGSSGELAGAKHGLTDANPDKTLGTYWPTATTLFDFVRRSMPPDAPGSLSDDQIYAVCAFLLHVNGIIGQSAEMNAATLPEVKMPNRDGFIRVEAH
jgi:mono/diheme cytochrome c family protein